MKFKTYIIHKFNLFLKLFPIKILSTEESIDYLLKESGSISRYGDGELTIILGGDIHFQKYNKELAKRLKEILSINEVNGFKVGIPISINNTKEYDCYTANFWESNMLTGRMHWHRLCNRNKTYLNASFTWCYMDYKNKKEAIRLFNKIPLIWHHKNILIVEGEKSKLGVNNSLFNNAKSIKRIICPSNNAFDNYNDIYHSILSLSDKFDLILVSLGPTATVLSYDLFKKGIRTIDIGHINKEYEDYLADNKIVENYILSITDYNKQIISIIE